MGGCRVNSIIVTNKNHILQALSSKIPGRGYKMTTLIGLDGRTEMEYL